MTAARSSAPYRPKVDIPNFSSESEADIGACPIPKAGSVHRAARPQGHFAPKVSSEKGPFGSPP